MSVATPHVDTARELLDLTRALIEAPSPNPPGDERAVVAVLERFLSGLAGVELRIFGPRPERPTLVAALGRGGRTLALAAHTDTHPIGEGWTTDPRGEARGDMLLGRGTSDNKGAVAAMAIAFRRIAERGRLGGNGRLLLVANADEETGGREGIEALCASWDESPDAVVVAEPSGILAPWESLWIAARGTLRFSLDVRGSETHSSLAGRPEVKSAVESLVALIDGMRDRLSGTLAREHSGFGRISRLTVVHLAGGSGWGVVPAHAHAACELRLGPGVAQDEIEAELERAFTGARAAVGAEAEISFPGGGLRWMAPSSSPADAPIVAAAARAWRMVFGVDPSLGWFPGGTDARLFEAAEIPTVIAGPGALVRAHRPDEYVTVDELIGAVDLYAAIAEDFLSLGSEERA